jgi:DNA repair exonuclease SbcCD ATPase subunit
MIYFKKIRWQNFLSTGNVMTEIQLDRTKSTLIVGENGAGKSTMLDALYFALFGRAFRTINKPQLVNSITGKHALVEIEFSIGKKEYMIRRGIKPAVFDIFIDGELVNQNSTSREYQDVLEKTILRMNPKSFGQIVVLGAANFVPFMQLPAQHRREVIEDLLDIQIFSIMNSLLKDKQISNKTLATDVDYRIDMCEQKIELHKKHIETLNRNNAAIIKQKEKRIEEYNELSEELMSTNGKLTLETAILSESMTDFEKTSIKLIKVKEMEKALKDRVTKISKEVKFFHDHDNCPTCKQGIDHDFKQQTIEKRNLKVDEIADALTKIDEEYTKLDMRIKEIDAINTQIHELNGKISDNFRDIQFNNNYIANLRNEIEELENDHASDTSNLDELRELKQDLTDHKQRKETLAFERQLHEVASYVLKDTGIKTKIIRQYVPIMNKLINKYLAAMDFFVQFELDETFNETIRSRFRDAFSYASFSEGEKMRIDLSLMFTWRAIAKLRNSASTNLLIMDEVFDSSLDSGGTEEFMKILDTLTAETNTFVISHKGDQLYDKFHSVIKFEKHSNFSRIAA